ncbi:MAG: hypothetical protein ACTMHW_03640 [Hafnia alvei]|jgi:hypothetical protein|uniref:Prophage protein n=3 Tax=Hafnia TaxID=568 RepID=A0A097R4G0_HAFAL|nr:MULTISPECIES: hypothetical protein [Hafniaceae]MDN5970683.1 hypothetical protein [Enterobacterales bacterium]AIU73615.1 hypothetical protein AT03_15260 [Hafnia alvei FB1]EHM39323.1 hypothetical protein HMPREF0454_03947 [Hafnia alvei ATCC 51873]KKI45215.1 hypothetical protein XK86_09050 [Hafnia alvei]MCE9886555.1 hypothetical protein [Obesumbacterium proteus]
MSLPHFFTALSILVGLAGALFLTYGVWRIYPPAGFIVAGLLCLVWSFLVSRMLGTQTGNPDKEG